MNLDTDGKLAKIFYTNLSTKYRFKNRELWQFKAVRQFKRTVAEVYLSNGINTLLWKIEQG